MSDLIPFDLGGVEVRFGTDSDGRPWVAAQDFAVRLGYRDAANALRNVDETEKGTQIVSTPGGDQRISVLYEEGIWELVFLSRRPEAKEVKARIKEILKEIRQTGRFEVASISRRELAQLIIAEADRANAAEAQVKVLQPKADYVDGFVNAVADATLLRVLANQLGTKEQALRDLLVQHKVIYRKLEGTRYSRSRGRQVPEYSWHAYSDYSAWFVERDQPEAPRLHNGQMRTTLYVTPVGKVKVAEFVARAGAA